MLTRRVATKADVEWLAPRLRQADIAEVTASGYSPMQALDEGLRDSEVPYVGVDKDDRAVVMFGACPTPDPLVASIWLLGSDAIRQHRMSFLRQSRGFVDELQSKFPILFNFVDERNAVHIEWLKWLGFTFLDRRLEVGPERRPFIEFTRFNPCALQRS